MKSLINGSSFIEKTVVQDTNDKDWLDYKSTTLKYKPEDIGVQVDSTATNLVFSNANANDRDVVVITTDGTTDAQHNIYVDGTKVVAGGADLTNIQETNKLTASDKADHDYFGISVAITSDGLIAMVGASAKDTDDITGNGQVYTYTTDIPV